MRYRALIVMLIMAFQPVAGFAANWSLSASKPSAPAQVSAHCAEMNADINADINADMHHDDSEEFSTTHEHSDGSNCQSECQVCTGCTGIFAGLAAVVPAEWLPSTAATDAADFLVKRPSEQLYRPPIYT